MAPSEAIGALALAILCFFLWCFIGMALPMWSDDIAPAVGLAAMGLAAMGLAAMGLAAIGDAAMGLAAIWSLFGVV